MLNVRHWTLLGIILAMAAMRLVPHPPNFTPLGAMALFGGAHFASRRAAFAVPLAAMFLSDLVLGHSVYHFGWYHATMPYVYASFVLTVCLGLWLRQHRSPLAVSGSALAAALLFFLVSNFGVWLQWNMYPKTFEGLMACYVAAIPFFGYTLTGNLVYSLVLFGGFALAQRHVAGLRDEAALGLAHG